MKSKFISVLLFFILFASPRAQSYFESINDGVKKYSSKDYSKAEDNFKKGITIDSSKFSGDFDLGTAQYKQNKLKEAEASFEKAISKAKTKDELAGAYHNLGNTLLKSNKYEESVDAYKKSLRSNPADKDTKYNLSVALEKLKQQQNQQKKNDKDNKNDKDKKDDKKKDDKDKKDKDKQDKDKKQDQDKNKDDKDKKKQPKPEPKMSKQQAEQMLNVLKDNEKDIQKKLRKRAAVKIKTEKDW